MGEPLPCTGEALFHPQHGVGGQDNVFGEWESLPCKGKKLLTFKHNVTPFCNFCVPKTQSNDRKSKHPQNLRLRENTQKGQKEFLGVR